MRHLAATGLLACLLGLAFGACGAAPSLASVEPTATVTSGPTLVPTSATSGVPVPADPASFTPPPPKCPAPPVAIDPPRLVASLGEISVAVTMGPSSVLTCSTVRSDDLPLGEPTTAVLAEADGKIRFELPDDWRFLYWGGSDHQGEGINLLMGGETAERPQYIDVPVPFRAGDSVMVIEAWVITADERAIGMVSGALLVRLP